MDLENSEESLQSRGNLLTVKGLIFIFRFWVYGFIGLSYSGFQQM